MAPMAAVRACVLALRRHPVLQVEHHRIRGAAGRLCEEPLGAGRDREFAALAPLRAARLPLDGLRSGCHAAALARALAMSVNLKLLNAFLLVAEHGSFRRAAELSRRSQSALSLQVRELEGQLGASLFHRTTRSVGLTREGEALLPHARRAIAEMEAGLSERPRGGGHEGWAARPRLPAACRDWCAAAVDRRLPPRASRRRAHVRELPQAEVLEGIRRQELDFGIGPRPAEAPSLTFAPLLEEKILALAPPRLVPRGAGRSIRARRARRSCR